VGSEATLTAQEGGLSVAVRALTVPARATGLARVVWVHEDHNNTSHGGLVHDLGAQVGVGPTAMRPSLRPLEPYPAAQVRQVFERDSPPALGGALDKCFGNAVVRVSLEALLAFRAFAAQLAGTGRALLLQLSAHMGVAGTQAEHLGACVLHTVAIRFVSSHGSSMSASTPNREEPVMLQVEADIERIVAVLHDVVEDTAYTLDDLHRLGYPDEAIDALDRLTRRDGEPYEAYIGRVAGDPSARRVKLADVADNLANHRRLEPTAQNRARVEQYKRAQARLLAP
jgi:hypothetical protein